uniref:Uncharacterized protein n=1 Tax=Cacopsylla melanoneura TaxID=428564 RepID=A0A8D8W6A8_9HEMI
MFLMFSFTIFGLMFPIPRHRSPLIALTSTTIRTFSSRFPSSFFILTTTTTRISVFSFGTFRFVRFMFPSGRSPILTRITSIAVRKTTSSVFSFGLTTFCFCFFI